MILVLKVALVVQLLRNWMNIPLSVKNIVEMNVDKAYKTTPKPINK